MKFHAGKLEVGATEFIVAPTFREIDSVKSHAAKTKNGNVKSHAGKLKDRKVPDRTKFSMKSHISKVSERPTAKIRNGRNEPGQD